MATVTKTKFKTFRGEARVTRNGRAVFRDTRTFDTKREALAWARETEESAGGLGPRRWPIIYAATSADRVCRPAFVMVAMGFVAAQRNRA